MNDPGTKQRETRRETRRGARLVPIALVVAFFVRPVSAQTIRNLDDDRFVKGLVDRGMTDLAAAFLKDYKTDDPLLKLEMAIIGTKIKAADRNQPQPERQKACREAIEAYHRLFAEAPVQHWKMPKWKTDFAEFAVNTVLSGDAFLLASYFAEFGTPTLDQEALFEELSGDMATVMTQASEEMFFLIGDLPRRDDFAREFENNGRWDMLVKEYNDLLLPYYLASARHFASVAGALDEAGKGKLADDEAALAALLERGGMSAVGVARTHILIARIRLRLGKLDEALKSLDTAAGIEGADPFDLFVAQLVRQQAFAAQDKKSEALSLLDALAEDPIATGSPIWMILIYDARHRITGDANEYAHLLERPSIKPVSAGVKEYVNKRIVERNPVAAGGPVNIEGKTALEVLAQADALVQKSAEGGEEKGKLLSAAVAWLEALIARGGLAPADEAAARSKLGFAHFKNNNALGAVNAWSELANTLPERPESEPAAVNAFKIAKAVIYDKNPNNPAALELYIGTMKTLLEKYPLAQLGPDQPVKLLWYTLAGVYLGQKDYEKAIETYLKVTGDHPFYADATYEMLYAQFELWQASEGDAKKARSGAFVDSADRAIGILAEREGQAEGDRRNKLAHMRGDAILMRGQVNAEALDKAGAVKVELANYDDQFGAFPDLIARKRQLLVNVLLQLGAVEDAKAEVERFKAANPDGAGPLIKGVLEILQRQVADARKVNPNDPKIAKLRQAGLEMAQDLHAWAGRQPDIAGDPEKMLFFEDLLGRELIAGGRCDEAVKLYEGLRGRDFGGGKTGADKIEVLLGLGRAQYCAGDVENASKPLNILINKGEKDSEPWWEAWLTRIQILDAQFEKLAAEDAAKARARRDREIYLAIQQLERQYPALGGPKYKTELIRLRNKNAN